jgi:hypothetical protein
MRVAIESGWIRRASKSGKAMCCSFPFPQKFSIWSEIYKGADTGVAKLAEKYLRSLEIIVSTVLRMDAISAQSRCLSCSDGVYSST